MADMNPTPPYSASRYEHLREQHRATLWIPWTLILLGIWMMLAPVTFGHLNPALWVEPSGGRGVWFSDGTHTALRASLMTWSDVLSGVLLVGLGWRRLRPDRPISGWLACGVGAWLNAAPLLFWAPTSAAYLNDTLVGMWVIALTILIPRMPNMTLFMRMGGARPPGWTYNPSSWPQRWIMIATGFLGYLASRALAMYQLGYAPGIWDPFFGEGSRRVLDSAMSHSLPISDAGLGTLAYTFEFLMGFMGGVSRWRTMPWMVALFGVLVIPLGLVHIVLVISQPLVVGAWCTLCLAAAAIMLPMIPLEVDEVVAMLQHVTRARDRGEGTWSVFWKGGDPSAAEEDEGGIELVELPERPGVVLRASVRGFSAPVPLLLTALGGLALMVLPGLQGVGGTAADVFHLGGALLLVVAVIAMAEVLRSARMLAVLLGGSVAVAAWVVDAPLGFALVGTLIAVTAAGAALPRGPVLDRYGTWDRFIR
ncbi:MAG: vitamin K epoxide reductase family protein [Gemmatimonadota bacterium]